MSSLSSGRASSVRSNSLLWSGESSVVGRGERVLLDVVGSEEEALTASVVGVLKGSAAAPREPVVA